MQIDNLIGSTEVQKSLCGQNCNKMIQHPVKTQLHFCSGTKGSAWCRHITVNKAQLLKLPSLMCVGTEYIFYNKSHT